MRILLSAFACEPGRGSERGIGWSWACGLARRHDVTVLTDESSRAPVEAELAANPVRGLDVRFLGSGASFRGFGIYRYYARWQRAALVEAQRLHGEEPFDVVHHITYGAHRQPSHLHRVGPPFIWGPGGGGEQVPVGFASPRWMPLRETAKELIRSLSNLSCRLDPRVRAMASAASVVAVTSEQTLAAFPRRARGRAVLANPITLDDADRAILGRRAATPPRAGQPSVAFVGRLVGWKGLGLALEAFRRYAAGRPEARFHIYGEGPAEAWLRRRTATRGLSGQVVLHGGVGRAELLARLADHHLFLFPSHHDSSGFAVVEALAAGLPVICLDVGGPSRFVPDGAGARIAPDRPARAVERLTAALVRLGDDPERWTAASAAARTAAADPDRVPDIDRLVDFVYGRLLAAR